MSLFTETITVQHAPSGTKDQQGNLQRDWSTAEETVYARVCVTPFSSTEADLSSLPRDQVFTGYKITSRRGVRIDCASNDRIKWDGSVWSVAATPEQWPSAVSNRTGHVNHSEVLIQRVTG